MEDKLKWNRLKEFSFGLIGYLLGTVIHGLLGYRGSTSRVYFGITFVVIARALYDIYRSLRYPEVKQKEKQLEKDERNIFIKYKSAYITLNITIFSLVIIWLIAISKGSQFTGYFASGVVVFMVAVMELSRYFVNKKI